MRLTYSVIPTKVGGTLWVIQGYLKDFIFMIPVLF